MAKLRARRGEVIHSVELSQREVNAIFYALEASREADDTYDVETHDYLEEVFGELWCENEELDIDEEGGPEEYSGYLTTVCVRDRDTNDAVINFSEALEKDRASHGLTDNEE